MAVTATDICNTSLTLIGYEGTVASLSDPGRASVECNRYYDQSRQQVLRMARWGFATKTALLVELADASHPIYSHVYTYPADLLRILDIHAGGTISREEQIDYEVELVTPTGGSEQRAIVSDTDEAYVKYIKDVTDPDSFDDLFRQCLQYYLAGHLAIPLLGDEGKRAQMVAAFTSIMPMSTTIDATERHETIEPTAPWISSRGVEGYTLPVSS